MGLEATDAVGSGQQWLQIGELLLAFGLSAIIGLERQLRGKSAGLRTQTIVGTSSALILIVSKYAFTDVLVDDHFVLDPSRVAAQIVSGIGFLGAGLIITRRGAIHGLTTAASVWETAAIGMACGAGAPMLAITATAIQLFAVTVLGRLGRRIQMEPPSSVVEMRYRPGRGALRHALTLAAANDVVAVVLATRSENRDDRESRVITSIRLEQRPSEVEHLIDEIARLPGVKSVRLGSDNRD